jgi:hypothetical protein
MKLPSTATTASIRDLKLLQAFATVFPTRDTITPSDLRDKVLGLVAKLCSNPQSRVAIRKTKLYTGLCSKQYIRRTSISIVNGVLIEVSMIADRLMHGTLGREVRRLFFAFEAPC